MFGQSPPTGRQRPAKPRGVFIMHQRQSAILRSRNDTGELVDHLIHLQGLVALRWATPPEEVVGPSGTHYQGISCCMYPGTEPRRGERRVWHVNFDIEPYSFGCLTLSAT